MFPVLLGDAKRPAVTGWRQRTAEEALREVEGWWRRWPAAEVGIPTGEGTGIYVVDEDAPGAVAEVFPESEAWPWRESSGREGHRHAWFRGGGPCRSSGQDAHAGWDLKGEGGMVVAWNGVPDEMPTLPAEVRRKFGGSRKKDDALDPELAKNRGLALNRLRIAEVSVRHAGVGERNQSLNRHAWRTADFVVSGALSVEEWSGRLVEASVASGYSEGEAMDVLAAVLRRK